MWSIIRRGGLRTGLALGHSQDPPILSPCHPLVPFSSVELVEAVEDIFVRAEDVASKAITEEDNS